MTTKTTRIEVCGISVEVVRKAIKNLHIRIYPPEGRVRVAAPSRMTLEAIQLAVTGRLGWIQKNQARFAGQKRQSLREYVTGESHFFKGKRYRLNVLAHEGRPKVLLHHGTIELFVPLDSSVEYREAVLYQWYRGQMNELTAELVEKWAEAIGVQVSEWGVKRMKTKWGTCNIKARRIWLNLELIKKPVYCLEYIIAHELVHLLERLHNDRFKGLMDQYVPLWRQYREELNHTPLEHGVWGE